MMTRSNPRPGPAVWTEAEGAELARLDTPLKIQRWLNGIAYDPEPGTASPRRVMRERKANCFEGAMFAAAALRFHGRPPLLVDMRSWNDDDHVLAVFRRERGLGLRGQVQLHRAPLPRARLPDDPRADDCRSSTSIFNPIGQKTLRAYSVPFDLSRFDDRDWMTTEEDVSDIGDALDRARHYRVLTPAQIPGPAARRIPPWSRPACWGPTPKGLFKPKR